MAKITRMNGASPLLINRASAALVPVTGTFELTPRCTMRCKMCYIVSDNAGFDEKKELTAQQWISLGREAVNQGLLFLQLTGGEAMMRSDFKEIYYEIYKLGVKISINTNATTITDDYIEFFKKYPPIRFSVSLYGASNETYERLCRFKNGYDIVSKNIDRLLEAGFKVKINITVTKYNSGDVEGICDFARRRDIPVHFTTFTFPPEKTSDYTVDDTRLDSFEAARVYIKCSKLTLDDDVYREYINTVSSHVMPSEVKEEKPFREGDDELLCHAGQGSYWVTWDGRMRPCVCLDNIETFPLRDGFKNAWDEITSQTKAKIRFPKKCAVCDLKRKCVACPAHFYEETGKCDEFSENICRFTQGLITCARMVKEGKDIDEI